MNITIDKKKWSKFRRRDDQNSGEETVEIQEKIVIVHILVYFLKNIITDKKNNEQKNHQKIAIVYIVSYILRLNNMNYIIF